MHVYHVRNLSALFSESMCAYGPVSLCSGLTESSLRHSTELAECLVRDWYVAFMVHCLSCFLRLPLSDRMCFVHEQSPFSVLYLLNKPMSHQSGHTRGVHWDVDPERPNKNIAGVGRQRKAMFINMRTYLKCCLACVDVYYMHSFW